MTGTARGVGPAPGSWLSIGLIYLYGVSTTASLSKIIPVLGDIGLHLGASPAQAALLISLVGVLPAITASVSASNASRLGFMNADTRRLTLHQPHRKQHRNERHR